MIKANIEIISHSKYDINYLYDIYEIGKIQTNLYKILKTNSKIKKDFDLLITVNEHPYHRINTITVA